jgi:hypothetical protein
MEGAMVKNLSLLSEIDIEVFGCLHIFILDFNYHNNDLGLPKLK